MAYDVAKLTKLAHLKALAQRAEEKYATKKALQELKGTVDGIVQTGGQANVLEGVKVNGSALVIAEKMVDILIATGATNGTIKVNGTDIGVKGLAALAYKAEVSYDDLAAALKAVIDAKAEASVVTTLIGEDTGKSARTIANEELAKQLIAEGAQESLDTLGEIAAWIQEHPDSAAAMNEAITALQNKIAGIPEEKTVKAYVDEAITALNIGDYAKTAWVTEQLGKYSTTEQMNAAIKVVDDKFASYYTSAQIDGMIATDTEVDEMLNEIIPAVQ